MNIEVKNETEAMKTADYMENDQARLIYVIETYKTACARKGNAGKRGKVENSIAFARIQDTLWAVPDSKSEVRVIACSANSTTYKMAVHNSEASERMPTSLTRFADRLSQFILTPPDI